MGHLPKSVVEAIEAGEPISEDQLRELITAEAKALNLTFEQAVTRAEKGRLPKGNPFAADIQMLVDLLHATAA